MFCMCCFIVVFLGFVCVILFVGCWWGDFLGWGGFFLGGRCCEIATIV